MKFVRVTKVGLHQECKCFLNLDHIKYMKLDEEIKKTLIYFAEPHSDTMMIKEMPEEVLHQRGVIKDDR